LDSVKRLAAAIVLSALVSACGDEGVPPTSSTPEVREAEPGGSHDAPRPASHDPALPLLRSPFGRLAHLDSVPRLIHLLTDWGVYEDVYRQMDVLGLWEPRGGWKPPPTEENDVRTVIESLLGEFADAQPALRRALHQ
jgi:hypothetical protein